MRVRSLALILPISMFLVSCHAVARFYPVQGPLATEKPSAVLVGKVSIGVKAGKMNVTGTQGEVFRGLWEAVERPHRSTTAPVVAPTDNEMAQLWDSMYGTGFYIAHVLGNQQYARASLKGNGADVLKVEFCSTQDAANASAVRGVAKDNSGNVYKMTLAAN